MSDRCTVYIGVECDATRDPAGARKMPVKLEVVTEEGETWVLSMTRSAWTRLLRTGVEVPGWIEPLEMGAG